VSIALRDGNPDLRFRLESGLAHLSDQRDPVVQRQTNKTGRDFDDVEAAVSAFVDIAFDGLTALGQDLDLVPVSQLDQLFDSGPGHERNEPPANCDSTPVQGGYSMLR
jgi:hypothetical protein